MPYNLEIELSLNGGVDYTDTNATYVYCKRNIMASLAPVLGPVSGNTELTIQYGDGTNDDCFEALSILTSSENIARAQCLFVLLSDTSKTFRSRISEYDSVTKIITCLTPSANLIDTDLFNNGGDVKVYISSNGIEYSLEDTFVFTYEPIPEISDLSPLFIYATEDTLITITGLNFQNNSVNSMVLTSGSIEITKVPTFVSDTKLEVTVLANEFLARSRVELKATFNGITYISSPKFISVAKRFTLQRLSQDYTLSSADKILVYIEEEVDSTGGLWDTQQNLM